MGKAVENRQREEIGRLEDLLIDAKSGRVESALLRLSEPPSAQGKLLAFAPRDFDIRSGGDKLVLDVSLPVLRRMPAVQGGAGGSNLAVQRASELLGGKLDDLAVDLRNGSVAGIAVRDGRETRVPISSE